MRYSVKRISIVPALKVSAVMHAILFLLAGILYGGVILIMSIVSFAYGGVGVESGGISIAMVLLSLIGLPILGLVCGAVMGVVFALLYNAVAEYIAPLRVELIEFEGKEEIEIKHPKI